MSFDLAVWVGAAPLDDRQAAETYARLMDELEAGVDTAPAPAIVAYVDALLARWPDLDQPGGERSPWASAPLLAEAWGDAIYFPMTFSPTLDEAVAFAAGTAREQGLVCYDPQSERLLR